jgi:trimethylamine-N-oxide reductase cytochrome c-type subunit TorC
MSTAKVVIASLSITVVSALFMATQSVKIESAPPSQMYTNQTTPLLASQGGPVVGSVTPGTPVMIIKEAGARVQVAVAGWSAQGAETALFAAPGQRILLANLDQPRANVRTILGQEKDSYGTVWQRVRMTGWVLRSSLVSDVSTVWKRGEQLYAARCGSCHALHPANERTANQWPGTLQSMAKRAGMTNEEASFILKYLQMHAKRP